MKYYLSTEDYQSMKLLSEEVQRKIDEMVQLATRVAGTQVDLNTVMKFVHQRVASAGASDGSAESQPQILWVEVFDPTPTHPEMCVVFYSDGHGVIEVPCGTPISG